MPRDASECAAALSSFRREVQSASRAVSKLVVAEQRIGKSRDNAAFRKSLGTSIGSACTVIQKATESGRSASSVLAGGSATQAERTALHSLEVDLRKLCEEYSSVATTIEQRQRSVPPQAPRRADNSELMPLLDLEAGPTGLGSDSQQAQKQAQKQAASTLRSDAAASYDEIADRDAGIQTVTHSILEVNQCMKDLNTLIHHQDPMVQQVEVNMEHTDRHVQATVDQIRRAARNQPKFLNWWSMLLMTVGCIIGLFLGIELFF